MSLVCWLPLNGDLHNQGCSNASVTNTSATINTAGKIGSCYSFGTSKSYLKFDNMNFIHNFTECSVSLWLKILSWNTSYATYFQFGLGSTPWAHYIFGLLRNSSASTLCFTISNGSSATNAGCLTPTLELNTWYHLTLTYTAGHCKIYVNGTQTNDYSTTIIPNFAGVTTGTIGAANNLTSYQTNCLINDFRVYNHCLSAAEVREISQGLVLHYKLDNNGHRNLFTSDAERVMTIAEGGTSVYSAYTYIDPIIKNNQIFKEGTQYTITYDYTVNSITSSTSVYVYSQLNTARCVPNVAQTWMRNGVTGSGHVVETFTVTQGQVDYASTYRVRWRINSGNAGDSITIRNVRFYLGTPEEINYISDSSGYNHNGTIIGSPIFASDNGRYNSYINFPSNTSHIQCGVITTSGFSNSYTFAWWGTKSAAGTMFWGFQDGVRLNGLYNNTLWNTGDGSNNPIYNIGTTTTITAPTVSNWHHYAMTGNGTKCYLYVDGQLYGEAKTYKSISGTQLWINGWQNSTNYAGYMNMSDFRVYCTALDADAIRQLYEVGAKVDNKGNLHTFEIKETNKNLLAGRLWTSPYNNHNPISAPFTNFNSQGEYQFNTNGSSASTEYIPINPTGHTYEYDYTISVNAGNQFYIGFERYDSNKTARSNNACVYIYATKPSTNVVKQHFTGTVNLSTDGTNPCAFITLRILNGWSGTTSGVTGTATIHSISLREIGTKQKQEITKQGQVIAEETVECSNTKIYKNGIIETNEIIEL